MAKHECPNAHCLHADVIVRNNLSAVLDVQEYDVEIEYCPYCGKYLLGTEAGQ